MNSETAAQKYKEDHAAAIDFLDDDLSTIRRTIHNMSVIIGEMNMEYFYKHDSGNMDDHFGIVLEYDCIKAKADILFDLIILVEKHLNELKNPEAQMTA